MPGTVDVSIQGSGKTSANIYCVIQFYSDLASVDQDTRDILQQSGCTLYDYVPNNAFYARIPPEALDTVSSLVKAGKARYLGTIPTETKYSQELLAKAQGNPKDSFRLIVHLFKDTSDSQISVLKELMQVDYYSEVSNFAYGTAPGSSLSDIVALNFVKFVTEEKSAHLTTPASDNQTATQKHVYVVVFRTMTSEYKNQVLSVKGVKYIRDTAIGSEGYSGIVISATPEAVDKIKRLNFVTDICRTEIVDIPMPRTLSPVELVAVIIMRLGIPILAVTVLVVVIALLIYFRKRRSSRL